MVCAAQCHGTPAFVDIPLLILSHFTRLRQSPAYLHVDRHGHDRDGQLRISLQVTRGAPLFEFPCKMEKPEVARSKGENSPSRSVYDRDAAGPKLIQVRTDRVKTRLKLFTGFIGLFNHLVPTLPTYSALAVGVPSSAFNQCARDNR